MPSAFLIAASQTSSHSPSAGIRACSWNRFSASVRPRSRGRRAGRCSSRASRGSAAASSSPQTRRRVSPTAAGAAEVGDRDVEAARVVARRAAERVGRPEQQAGRRRRRTRRCRCGLRCRAPCPPSSRRSRGSPCRSRSVAATPPWSRIARRVAPHAVHALADLERRAVAAVGLLLRGRRAPVRDGAADDEAVAMTGLQHRLRLDRSRRGVRDLDRLEAAVRRRRSSGRADDRPPAPPPGRPTPHAAFVALASS